LAIFCRSAARRHARSWRWLAGADVCLLAIAVALWLAHVSFVDRTIAGIFVLLDYIAILVSMLVASSSQKTWVSAAALISYFIFGLTSFMVALPSYPLFDFLTSDLLGPRFFHQDLGGGLVCEANERGGLDDFARVTLHRQLTYAPFLQRDLDGRLEPAITADPKAICQELKNAHPA
jgi:hypothetical protein